MFRGKGNKFKIAIFLFSSFLVFAFFFLDLARKTPAQKPPFPPPDSTPTPTATPTTTTSSQSSNAISPAAGAPTCDYGIPSETINLFRIDTTQTSAMLYFTSIKDTTSYQIFFGYSVGDTRFAGTFPSRDHLPYTVDHLAPDTTYYFAVKGENVCAGGKLSNWRSAKTKSSSESATNKQKSNENIQPTPTSSEANIQQSSNLFQWLENFVKQLFH